jgi:alpha-galactosidase
MKYLRHSLAALGMIFAAQVPAHAAGLNGVWRMEITKDSGVVLRSYIILHQDGEHLTGQVFANSSDKVKIEDARVDGEDGVFRINWGWAFRVHPMGPNLSVGIVRAADARDEFVPGPLLHVTVTYSGGGKDEATAVPVAESEMNPPARIEPPTLRDLPDNGLARTPPMGWNSWNHFAERVDDSVVRKAADAMVSSGMAAAGYLYVNIDDTWEGGRDAGGNIVPNRKFPDMKALADYVHSKGLKLGIYSSPGPLTCGGYVASYAHEEQDARTFASWGIDYLKYDWCSAGHIYPKSDLRAIYQKMGEALERSGRPIVYSLCEYGMGDVWAWAPKVGGNLWRTTGDIQDNWSSMSKIGFNQGRLAPFGGPGHWNDPDMLEVGNGGMTADEYRTHFSIWCMLSAPLMAGNDLSSMSDETRDILANREVIAIDQDALGREASKAFETGEVEVWTRPLADGSLAVGLFNHSAEEKRSGFTWSAIGLAAAPAGIRDLWRHEAVAPAAGGYDGLVPGHGVVLLRLK